MVSLVVGTTSVAARPRADRLSRRQMIPRHRPIAREGQA
jgi:hypothetical protein